MTAGAVHDPATDMRLRHNRFVANPALPGILRAVLSPKSKCVRAWMPAETLSAGRIWLHLEAHPGCACAQEQQDEKTRGGT